MVQFQKSVYLAFVVTLLVAALSIVGCVGSRDGADASEAAARGAIHAPYRQTPTDETSATTNPPPQIIATSIPLECVPYARKVSNVSIRGDAWTWWQSASGRYLQDSSPAVGSILVLERTNRLRYGHVAVVSRVVNRREILVDHANWLNRGHVHKHLPVRDVSPNNDWSVVRVWYAPGNTLGKRMYPAYGFIHPLQARVLLLREPKMQGPDVRVLQESLALEGFKVVTDGIFGSETRDAVAAYQARNGLTRDGVAGSSTLASLGL